MNEPFPQPPYARAMMEKTQDPRIIHMLESYIRLYERMLDFQDMVHNAKCVLDQAYEPYKNHPFE